MFIDLVYCTHTNCGDGYLFRAPFCSYLENGTSVKVETKKGVQPATVIKSIQIADDSNTYRFMLTLAGATHPLKKVLAVLRERELYYGEEKENDE